MKTYEFTHDANVPRRVRRGGRGDVVGAETVRFTVPVDACSGSDAPVAFVVHGKDEVRWVPETGRYYCKSDLWTVEDALLRILRLPFHRKEGEPWPFAWDEPNIDDLRERLAQEASRFLMVEGTSWLDCSMPCYEVRNVDAPDVMVWTNVEAPLCLLKIAERTSTHFERQFGPCDLEKAVEAAWNWDGVPRRSVTVGERIEVLIPEAVSFDPQKYAVTLAVEEAREAKRFAQLARAGVFVMSEPNPRVKSFTGGFAYV